jgi:hypothetical protein
MIVFFLEYRLKNLRVGRRFGLHHDCIGRIPSLASLSDEPRTSNDFQHLRTT